MRTSTLVRVRVSLFSILFCSFISLVFATPASDPASAITYSGVSALKSGDYGTATTDFYQALSLASTGTQDYLRAEYYLARSFTELGNGSTAQAFITPLVQNYPAVNQYVDGALYYQMRVALLQNNFTLLSTSFVQLTTTYPQAIVMPAAYLRYGDGCRLLLHNFPMAAQYYQYLVDNYSTDTYSTPVAQLHIAELWMHGYLKNNMGQMDSMRAISEAQKVINQWPNTEWAVEALYTQCLINHNMGSRSLARSIAQSIVSTYTYSQYSTVYVSALYNLAFFDYYYDKNWNQALSDYSTLIQQYPTSYVTPEAQKQIARINYFQGNISQAIIETQKIIDNYPNSIEGQAAVNQIQILQSIQSRQSTANANQNNLASIKTKSTKTSAIPANYCGPIALHYVLLQYGISASIQELAKAANYNSEGTSFAGLAKAAIEKGLLAKGFKTNFKTLTKLPLPLIVQLNHRQRDHFIVIQKMDKKNLYFVDQRGEHQTMTQQDFTGQWTGYALSIMPKENFALQKNNKPPSIVYLDKSQMELVMGGDLANEATQDCANNWATAPTHGCINPGGGEFCGNACGCSGRGSPGGGAITAVGNGGGNSAVSLAVNGGNGWSYTVFPEMSIPSIRGGHSVVVYRSYASSRYNNGDTGLGSLGNYGEDQPWGTLWTINYATHLDIQTSSLLYWVNENGDQILYNVQSDNTTYLPANAQDQYAIYNTITMSGGTTYILQFQNGTQYVFDSVQGFYARLVQINYPNNNTVTCQYADSTSNYLTSITDPAGRQLTFGYSYGKLTSITDPWGRSVQYTYNSSSDLTQIQDPDGYTMYYTYNTCHQIITTRDSFSGTTNLYTYTYGGNGADTAIDTHGVMQCSAIGDSNGTQTQFYSGDSQIGGIPIVACGGDPDCYIDGGCVGGPGGIGWWYDAGIFVISNNTVIKSTQIYFDSDCHQVNDAANADVGAGASVNIRYSYDENGDVTDVYDANDNQTYYRVDMTYGHTTAIQDVAGNITYAEFDTTYNVMTCSIDASGKRTYYSYDTQWNLLSITDPLGNITHYAYDSYGNRTSSTDPVGEVTRFFYDSYSELTMVIKWDNSTTVSIYDTYENRTAVIDPLGNKTFYSFDTMRRLLSVTDSQGNVTQYTYYVNGLLKSVTDANGNATNYVYDLRNHLIQEINAANDSTKYWYDSCDNVTTRLDAKNQKTYYSYDSMNRLITRKYDTGTTVYFAYDALGNTTSINDPNYGGMVYYTYDVLSRVTNYSNPWGSMSYAYDNDSRRTGLLDPNGNLYGYYNDADGRLSVLQNYALNQWTLYAYDSLSRKSLEIYPNGVFTAYTYTSCGCGNQITDTLSYKPTDNFNRSSLGSNWTQAAGSWGISNNQLYVAATSDQMAVYSTGGSVSNPTVECSLDMHTTYPNINGFLIFAYSNTSNFYYAGTVANATTFLLGHVSAGAYSNDTKFSGPVIGEFMYRLKVTVSGTTVTLYWFNSTGYQYAASYIYGTAVPAGETGVMSAYAYTSFDNFTLNNLTTVIAQYTYDYDKAGNRTDMFDLTTSTTFYYYDSLNRLSMESCIGINVYTRVYTYDGVGNRLSMINGTTTVTYAYNNLNQLTSSTTGGSVVSYSYDNNGNQTGNGSISYTWDYENGLTAVTGVDSPPSYVYDALGRRIEKIDPDNNLITQYIYDGINVLSENQIVTGDDGGEHPGTDTYTLAPGNIKEIVSDAGTGYFYHYDPIGNVLFITNTNGNIVTRYVQEGFGNVLAGSATNSNYNLTTKEQDPNTGLYYFGARWYDPSVGRFISKDPLGQEDDPNSYIYVYNNPLKNVDPNGEITVLEGLVGVTIVSVLYIIWWDKYGKPAHDRTQTGKEIIEFYKYAYTCQDINAFNHFATWLHKALDDANCQTCLDAEKYDLNIAKQWYNLAGCQQSGDITKIIDPKFLYPLIPNE